MPWQSPPLKATRRPSGDQATAESRLSRWARLVPVGWMLATPSEVPGLPAQTLEGSSDTGVPVPVDATLSTSRWPLQSGPTYASHLRSGDQLGPPVATAAARCLPVPSAFITHSDVELR